MVEQTTKIPFYLVFISDDMSNAVRASLRQAGLQDSVRVVDIPPANLKQQLVRNRAYDRLCERPNCIVCPNERQGSEEGDDAETLARIKINNNHGSAQKVVHNQTLRCQDSKKVELET
ncbi:hypothetical protein RB195_023864 [Necator americanus]|uniref:Uncharacterized protein n=1 Tax=Necator americanus TaxID=51031 RepID=A0ABR1EKY8_NECAM